MSASFLGDMGGERGDGSDHALTSFLLTAADIVDMRLSARVVVLSCGYTDERAGRTNTDGVTGLTHVLLAAGARCVVFPLWPVPEFACRTFLKAFYAGLLQGAHVTTALGQATQTVRGTQQLAHPANWAGWVVVGAGETQLTSRVTLMGQSLCDMLRRPADTREAMRTVLHLVSELTRVIC
jgi:CHAT domain-containing protein